MKLLYENLTNCQPIIHTEKREINETGPILSNNSNISQIPNEKSTSFFNYNTFENNLTTETREISRNQTSISSSSYDLNTEKQTTYFDLSKNNSITQTLTSGPIQEITTVVTTDISDTSQIQTGSLYIDTATNGKTTVVAPDNSRLISSLIRDSTLANDISYKAETAVMISESSKTTNIQTLFQHLLMI